MEDRKFGIVIAIGLLLLITVSGCAERDRNQQDTPKDMLVTVSDWPAPTSTNVPSSIVLNWEIRRNAGAYDLFLSWQFSGTTPDSWRVDAHIDRQDGTGNFFFVGTANLGRSDAREFRSEALQLGRMYRFELSAASGTEAPSRYKTVTVDLRKVQ